MMDNDRSKLPELEVSKQQAIEMIDKQIEKGLDIKKRCESIDGKIRHIAESDKLIWFDFNCSLLMRIFNNNLFADQYRECKIMTPWGQVLKLQGIRASIELLDEKPTIMVESKLPDELNASRKVFVVYGHDKKAKDDVELILRRLDLIPTIYDREADKGRNILQKLIDISDVGFAVVLLTPDDVGKSVEEEALQPRARQNVVFELGYFIGKLGHSRVCALNKGIERPSDYDGILYTEMDSDGKWKAKLAKEISAAGIQVNIEEAD